METRTISNDEINHLAIGEGDLILKCWVDGAKAEYVTDWKQLHKYPTNVPVAFRGMTGRKIVNECEKQGRDFFYVDTGYFGNNEKRKKWHRVVKNDMQHKNVRLDLPPDRWAKIQDSQPRQFRIDYQGWKKAPYRKAILVVTPSEKPCKYYGITRDQWVNETLTELKKHTNRPIIIRDKSLRRERVGQGSLFHQLDNDNIFAVVTYNSIAATEAIMYGIPAFTGAPGAADKWCEKDLSKIETPKYSDPNEIKKWLNWLAYCQYTTDEMTNGTALGLIKEYNLG